MICVSLGRISSKECRRILRQVEMAEIRIDLMDWGREEVKAIFSSHPNLIATCRPGKQRPMQRQLLLLEAITSGARYVDLDLNTDMAWREDIQERAKKKGCQVIISYHQERWTPPRAVLERIIKRAFSLGANLAKIACFCRHPEDNARLLGLLDGRRRVIVCGLGPLGSITRLATPLCGGLFTYAFWEGLEPTARGQVSYQTLEKIHQLLEKMQAR